MDDTPAVSDHPDDIWVPVQEASAPTPSPTRRPGLAIIGAALVLGAGALIAYAAVGSSDGGERPVGRALALLPQYPPGQEPVVEVPGAVPTTEVRLVPTTLPNEVLPTGCGDWDRAFSFAPAEYDGLAIWSDFEGWHVRLAPGDVTQVAGRLSAQVVPDIDDGPLPAGVELVPDPATASVAFTIVAGDEPVGFDFQADCAQKQLSFTVNGPTGGVLPIEYVDVGEKGRVVEWPVVAQRSMPTPGS